MDLKELLPVLLITVFAIISAAKKKKQPISEMRGAGGYRSVRFSVGRPDART